MTLNFTEYFGRFTRDLPHDFLSQVGPAGNQSLRRFIPCSWLPIFLTGKPILASLRGSDNTGCVSNSGDISHLALSRALRLENVSGDHCHSFVRLAGRAAFFLAATVLVLVVSKILDAQTQPIQYVYDDLGRLVTVIDFSGNVVTYTYDAVGNILQIGRSKIIPGSLALSIRAQPWAGADESHDTRPGFNATASSDIVDFNGTAATVTSASATSLVATVPVGATTGPISVTVGTNTVISTNNFVVIGSQLSHLCGRNQPC